MKVNCNVWEGKDDLSDLADLDSTPEALLALATEVRSCEDAESVVDPLWRLLWTLRRALWGDLIASGRGSVGFEHDQVRGYGLGPVVCWGSPATPDRPAAWGADDAELAFSSGDTFVDSDTMHMEYGSEPGLFGWPEFFLRYLSLEEYEAELGEHSFSARCMVDVNSALKQDVWTSLHAADQVRLLFTVLGAHELEMDEFKELWVNGSDVLALMASHPSSSIALLEAGHANAGDSFAIGLAQR